MHDARFCGLKAALLLPLLHGYGLAPKARTYTSLGQRPRKRANYYLSAESAVYCGDASVSTGKMERAFSPKCIGWQGTWGVAPGWYEPRLWR